jgi:hypothetical protein
LVVTTTEQYITASDTLKAIKALRAKIGETFDPHIARAFQAHRALTKEKSDAETPLTEAERIIKGALVTYDQEQARLQRLEEARLREEARLAEETRVLNLAAAMEAEGQQCEDVALVAEAHALISEPIQAPPIAPVVKATPKITGITYRTTYSAQVINLHELVKFVAANPSHLGLLSANMPALNGQARSLKLGLRLPGVKVHEARDVAAGSR